jgi:hypothetical protein
MEEELVVILGALIILTLSIAGMNIYRWRTDVLTGPYIFIRDRQLTVPAEMRADRTSRTIAEKRRATHPFFLGWKFDSLALDARRKAIGHSSNRVTDPDQLPTGLQSTVVSIREFNEKKVTELLTAKSGLTRSSESPTGADRDPHRMKGSL